MPLDRLCLSPQCGFSSTVHGNQITEADQWAKLERLLELARRVWDDAVRSDSDAVPAGADAQLARGL